MFVRYREDISKSKCFKKSIFSRLVLASDHSAVGSFLRLPVKMLLYCARMKLKQLLYTVESQQFGLGWSGWPLKLGNRPRQGFPQHISTTEIDCFVYFQAKIKQNILLQLTGELYLFFNCLENCKSRFVFKLSVKIVQPDGLVFH